LASTPQKVRSIGGLESPDRGRILALAELGSLARVQ
jgi:hypothetical protein